MMTLFIDTSVCHLAPVYLNMSMVQYHNYHSATWHAGRGSEATDNSCFNTLRPRQNGRHYPDNIFKYIFLNENASISKNVSLKFVPMGPINNIPALVQIMAWRHSGAKPLSEPMKVSLLTHICVTRPQWVNITFEWPLTLQVLRHFAKYR